MLNNQKKQAMKIQMRNGYVLIKDEKLEDITTKGGIVLPQKWQRIATIVAVPDGETKFNVGDRIIKPIGKGTPITIDGEEYEAIRGNLLFARL